MNKITGIFFLFLCLFFLSEFVMGQSITINPTNPSPSSLYIHSPDAAGTKPTSPLPYYAGQSITYLFPTGWGNIGQIDVNSTTIPPGLSIIIQASNGNGGTDGISTGPVIISSTYTPIINGIAKVRKDITRLLTQAIVISDLDFSNLHSGQYSFTINLWVH